MSSAVISQDLPKAVHDSVEALGVDMGGRLRECRDHRWFSHPFRLISEQDILESLTGKKIIGYTGQRMTNVIARDIDTHDYLPGLAEEHQARIYFHLVEKHGWPSLVVRTRSGGGLHAYWWFDRHIPFETLYGRLKDMVPDVEIGPTPRRPGSEGHVLRFPLSFACGGHHLDPKTLEKLPTRPGLEAAQAIREASTQVVSLERFLGMSPETAKAILYGAKSQRVMKRNLSALTSLDKVVAELATTHTNDPIMAMVRRFKYMGWSPEQVAHEIDYVLTLSGVPRNRDTSPRHILTRVKSAFRCSRPDPNEALKPRGPYQPQDLSLFVESTAQAITEKIIEFYGRENIHHHRLAKLPEAARAFVMCMDPHLKMSDAQIDLMTVNYPGHRRKVRVFHLCPIPVTLWRRFTQRYQWFREALMVTGIVRPGWDTSRGPNAGYCPPGMHPDREIMGKSAPKVLRDTMMNGTRSMYAQRAQGVCRYYHINLPKPPHTDPTPPSPHT